MSKHSHWVLRFDAGRRPWVKGSRVRELEDLSICPALPAGQIRRESEELVESGEPFVCASYAPYQFEGLLPVRQQTNDNNNEFILFRLASGK